MKIKWEEEGVKVEDRECIKKEGEDIYICF